MTAAETQEAFLHYIDQYTTSRPEDVDFWVNQGIIFYIKSKVDPGIDYPNRGFQLNQRVRDDLSNVIRVGVTLAYVNGIADYPNDFYMLIPHSVSCTNADQSIKKVPYIRARARSWDWLYANELNPFCSPEFKNERLVYIESEEGIHLKPSLVYTEVKADYIKTWPKFETVGDVRIPLKVATHEEVTKLAASKYLTSIHNFKAAEELMKQVISE